MTNPLTLLAPRPVAVKASEDDQALAVQASQDSSAFANLYRQYLPRIYRYHLARTGDEQDAQDLSAQTFLAALEQIEKYRGQSSLLSWLFGIASHKLADHFRRQRHHLALDEAETLPNPTLLPEEQTNQNLQMAEIAQALQRISPQRAEALILRLIGGLSTSEVAQVMGKTEAAVKMLVHRGLHELQESFQLNEVER